MISMIKRKYGRGGRWSIAVTSTSMSLLALGGVGATVLPAQSGQAKSDAASLRPATLNVYLPEFIDEPSPGSAAVFAAANRIIKAKINATVNFHLISSTDYATKMATQLAAGGSSIDLLAVANWLAGWTTPAEEGAFTPMNSLLKQYGQGIEASMPKDILDSGSINGKIYGITTLQLLPLQPSWTVEERTIKASGVKGTQVDGNFFLSGPNKYKEASIMPIVTAAKKSLPPESSTFSIMGYDGNYATPGEQGGFDPLAYGLWPISSSLHTQYPFYVKMGTTTATLGLPEIKSYVEMMRTLFSAGDTPPDVGTNVTPPPATPAQIAVDFNWTGGGALETYGQKTVVGEPAGEVSYEIPLSPRPFYMGFNYGWAIPRGSKNASRAMMLLNLLNTNSKLMMLLSYGFKNADYTVKNDAVTLKSNATYTAGTSCWVWGNCFITPRWPYASTSPLKGSQFWSDAAKFLDNSVVSPLDTFTFNFTPVSSEYANVASVAAQYDLPLFSGAVPVGPEFAAYESALGSAGAETVLKQVQAQLNRYLKANPAAKKALLSMTYGKLMSQSPIYPGQP